MTLSDARRAVDLAESDPALSLELARRLLAEAGDGSNDASAGDSDQAVATTAGWAEGLALYEMGRNRQSVQALQAVVEQAAEPLRSRVGVSLAAAETAAGENESARARLRTLADHGDPVIQALAISQLGVLELHAGDLPTSLELLEQALPALEEHDAERPARARVLGNIGFCLLMLGRLEQSRSFHRAALETAELTGQKMIVAGSLQNMGYTEMKLGDLPSAIDYLERAREAYTAMTGFAVRNLATLYDDLAETYRVAGLTAEAVHYATLASSVLREGGNIEKSTDADYRQAICLLDHGDFEQAERCARRAAHEYEASDRPAMARRAGLLAIEAALASDAPIDAGAVGVQDEAATGIAADEVTSAVEDLTEAGWHTDAAALVNLALGAALDAGDAERAAALQTRPPLDDQQGTAYRLERLYFDVLQARHNGIDPAAPLARAQSFLETHRSGLGDPELRAHSARLSERFRVLAVRHALRHGSPTDALETEEAWRALSFRLPRVIPPPDETTAELIDSMRQLSQPDALEVADADGLADAVGALRGGGVDDRSTERQRRDIERELRVNAFRRSHHGVGGGMPDRTVAELVAAMDQRTLVEFISDGRTLFGVRIGPEGRTSMWEVGPAKHLEAQARSVRHSIARLLRSAVSGQSAVERLTADCRAMGERLFPDAPAGVELVLSPPPELMDLPWSLIVRDDSSAMTLTPRALGSPASVGEIGADQTAMIGGPDLEFVPRDAATFRATFPDSTVVTGPEATTVAFREMLEQASLLHISAHGTFRSDSPRFSTISLADGPFTMYELERVATAPSVVVLAACEAGRSLAVAGGELLGTAPTFLAAGTATVVAPILAVLDEEISQILSLFYEALPGGAPHHALLKVHQQLAGASPRLWATAHSLQIIGADPPTIRI